MSRGSPECFCVSSQKVNNLHHEQDERHAVPSFRQMELSRILRDDLKIELTLVSYFSTVLCSPTTRKVVMNKPKKTAKEIRELITAKLREDNRFSNVTPLQPYLHERDSDGSNWDLEKWSGSHETAVAAKQYLQDYVNSLRAQFDIEN